MQYQTHDLFPTSVVRVNCSDLITAEDQQMMMQSVDQLIEMGLYTQNELTPKYQTHVILFQDDAPEIWKRLRTSFYGACKTYLEVVKDFTGNQHAIEFTGSGAWCYKGWKSLNERETNPYHHHNPAFLSGVYYLRVPGNGDTGGTEFHDPRTAPAIGTRNQCVSPVENSWVIFPGWLQHRSSFVNTEEPRYVIAANIYAKVK
jgi:hypothetical protein